MLRSLLISILFFMCLTNMKLGNIDESETIVKVLPDISEALSADDYFRNFSVEGYLGKGGYGVVLGANDSTQPENKIAVKISSLNRLDFIADEVDAQIIRQNEAILMPQVRAINVINYLKKFNVPFLVKVTGNRFVLARDTEDPNKLLVNQVTAMELGNVGTLNDYGRMLNGYNLAFDLKKELALKIMFQIALSISKTNENKILHGDIKGANIFVRKCNSKYSIVCPIIGDWDLGHHINTSKFNVRYTSDHRPIEMRFFHDLNELKLLKNHGGYQFTGKEDVFALGITFIKFLNLSGVGYESGELRKLIEGMIYPLTIDKLGIYYLAEENGNNEIRDDLHEGLIDANYVAKVKNITKYIKNHYRKFGPNASLHVEEAYQAEKALKHNPLVFYNKFMNAMWPDIKKLKKEVKKSDKFNEFNEMHQDIEKLNPLNNIKKNRKSASEVADELAKLVFGVVDKAGTEALINQTLDEINNEDRKLHEEDVSQLNIVYLTQSFYSLPYDSLQGVFNLADCENNADVSHLYDEKGDLKLLKSCSKSNFCPYIETYLEVIKETSKEAAKEYSKKAAIEYSKKAAKEAAEEGNKETSKIGASKKII